MAAPTTTGTTMTRAMVAGLRWERKGSMAAPRASEVATPSTDPTMRRCTLPLSPELAADGTLGVVVQNLFRRSSDRSDRFERSRGDARPMADFLAVLGIIAFVVAMLGLIWALDRV